MPNINRLNETLRKEIALAIEEAVEFPDGLITVSWTECAPNLASARIAVSVLPDNLAGSALEKLRASSGAIAEILKDKMRLRKIPKFIWTFDATEKKAGILDKAFLEVEKEKDKPDEEIEEITFKN